MVTFLGVLLVFVAVICSAVYVIPCPSICQPVSMLHLSTGQGLEDQFKGSRRVTGIPVSGHDVSAKEDLVLEERRDCVRSALIDKFNLEVALPRVYEIVHLHYYFITRATHTSIFPQNCEELDKYNRLTSII